MPNTSTQRRRSSSSSRRRTFGSAWKRLWARVPEGVTATVAFVILLLIGLALLVRSGPSYRFAALTASGVGVTGLAWQGWFWLQRLREERQLQEAAELKVEKHTMRRQRHAEEKEDRQRRTATDSSARERARQVEELARRAATDKTTAERAYRRGREEAIARDAMRLLTMSEISLLDAAAEAFDTRGFTVGRDVDDMRLDLLLRGEDGDVRIVARLAPLGRKADVSEVDALDARREEMRAAAGILISIGGFTPAAVRQASTLPATLAEAHLLAQWRVGGALEDTRNLESAQEEKGA